MAIPTTCGLCSILPDNRHKTRYITFPPNRFRGVLKISVVIPTYHHTLLAQCLDRLAPGRQTLDASQYEVIVSDDALQPTAREMMAQLYPWAKWVQGPRKGPAANRNNGVQLAEGGWLVFTDDDCLPDPGWLAAYSNAIDQDASMVLEGKTTCMAGIHSPLLHAPVNLTGGWLWSCNLAVRHDFFHSIGGFDENFPMPHMEDVDFRQRAIATGSRLQWVPDAIVDHPPRKVALFRASVPHHECEVIYEIKQGRKPRLLPMLLNVLRSRIKTLHRFRPSGDSLVFAASTAVEALWFVFQFRTWVTRNAHMNASESPQPSQIA